MGGWVGRHRVPSGLISRAVMHGLHTAALCVSVGGFLGRSVTARPLVVCYMQVGLLRNLCHPNIVQYLDSFLEDDVLVIVLEWAGGGDLKVSRPPASQPASSSRSSGNGGGCCHHPRVVVRKAQGMGPSRT